MTFSRERAQLYVDMPKNTYICARSRRRWAHA